MAANCTKSVAAIKHNKALKAFASLTGTVLAGAASHCRAGSSCPLAWRYIQMKRNLTKILIFLVLVAQESGAVCFEESKHTKIHIKVESCKVVEFSDFPELKEAEEYLKNEKRAQDLLALKKKYEGIVIYYYGEPYFFKTADINACEKYPKDSEHDFILKYPCCDILPLAAGEVPCGIGEHCASIESVER